MRHKQFTFYFKGGPITVWAFTEANAKILAQAEAIKRCWDPTIIPKPNLELLNMVINWDQLDPYEQTILHGLLRKAHYNKGGEQDVTKAQALHIRYFRAYGRMELGEK